MENIDIQTALSYLRFQDDAPNVLPVNGKSKLPGTLSHRIRWKQFQQERMTRENYYSLFKRDDPFDAVGIISGVNGWRCFDFDKCISSSPVYELLDILGLDEDYEWVVESGSKKGFHVWVRSGDLPSVHGLSSGKTTGVFSAPGIGFDHLELRWERCQTLIPPSVHISGNHYSFLHCETVKNAPAIIKSQTIVNAFFELTSAVPVIPKVYTPKTVKKGSDKYTELINRLNVEDIFTELGWKYTQDGENFVGECPNHSSVSGTPFRWKINDGFFRCFHAGCGVSGDILSMISVFLKKTPFDAAFWASSHFAPDLKHNFQCVSPYKDKK